MSNSERNRIDDQCYDALKLFEGGHDKFIERVNANEYDDLFGDIINEWPSLNQMTANEFIELAINEQDRDIKFLIAMISVYM